MGKTKQRIFVTVDDLGLHPAVFRAVDLLSRQGRVHAASLMANGPYLDDALALRGQVELGAHLNLLRGPSTLDPEEIPSLLREDGYFLGSYWGLYFKYLMGRLNLAEIEAEWAAQIERLLEMGFSLSHLDSEKHIHCWPQLQAIVFKLAKRFGIKRVRRPMEVSIPCSLSMDTARAWLLRYWCRQMNGADVAQFCTDSAWGLTHQGADLRPELLRNYLEPLPEEASVEVVCHPGLREDGDPALDPRFGATRIESMWAAEFLALRDLDWGLF